MNSLRRRLLQAAAAMLGGRAAYGAAEYPAVVPGRPLVFPADHGAHPDFRTEWWYVTGWLQGQSARYGFQVTFFRNRPGVAEDLPVPIAPRQLLFAHAAVAASGRLIHDQRSARAAWGLAYARERRMDVAIDDWSLRQEEEGRLRTVVRAARFAFDLGLAATDPVLLEGVAGFSRKGPAATQASYYYSWPQLRVTGTLDRGGGGEAVEGLAWLDHEWSSEYMAAGAVGWDWTGVNLADGGALMAFRMRAAGGGIVWAGATWRRPDGSITTFAPGQVSFEVLRTWRSPSTGAAYPVSMRVRAGDFDAVLAPLFDNQELDARASVGTVYWEGAVEARRGDVLLGRGYLELTGYAGRLSV